MEVSRSRGAPAWPRRLLLAIGLLLLLALVTVAASEEGAGAAAPRPPLPPHLLADGGVIAVAILGLTGTAILLFTLPERGRPGLAGSPPRRAVGQERLSPLAASFFLLFPLALAAIILLVARVPAAPLPPPALAPPPPLGAAVSTPTPGALVPSPAPSQVDPVFILLPVVLGGMALGLWLLRGRGEGGEHSRRHQAGAFVLLLALALPLVLELRGATSSRPVGAAPPPPASRTHGHPFGSSWVLPALVATLLAGGLAGGLMLGSARRRRLAPRPRTASEAARGEALEVGIEALRHEREPRWAVIAAYAGMEGTLGRQGLPRRPFEAPFEYLDRVVQLGPVDDQALRLLTTLFERARFSRQMITPAMRDDAIAALEAIRREHETRIEEGIGGE